MKIAAILTVIGFADNEMVVIFDRIREYRAQRLQSSEGLDTLINRSVGQLLRRSLYTLLTVITGAVCLYFFGAEPLQMFSLAIFVGLLCGTFASLMIVPQLWMFIVSVGTGRDKLKTTSL